MPHYVASDLGLHCLPMILLRVSWLEWVNHKIEWAKIEELSKTISLSKFLKNPTDMDVYKYLHIV